MDTYLLLINALAALLMFLDKRFARRNLRRIPESTLLLAALLGGSPGVLFGMALFHHKTKHRKFMIGVPILLAVQLLLVFVIGSYG